ncbi:hypothetical protein [Piscibacillus salipiscarius]|uniref:hypothetical protein n=1 Tax=Piscibacillus salipiscarius TaxID=299480 RepID=UPI0006D07F6A|nr:hypothetical protein [Piscibacillus salipiscarius]
MLTLSLDHIMYPVLKEGLNVIQANQKPILDEWNNIINHFKSTGKKSADDIEATVNFSLTTCFLMN